MTNPNRLDAPPADMRALDRGKITKHIGVEPRVCPNEAQEKAALLAKLDKDTSDRLAKAAPAPQVELTKAVKTVAALAELAMKAAERCEAAARRIEAAQVQKASPTLKTALEKADFAKKGR